jgi:predicted DCC family thiol-disulfide oxidoreductase YuxK
MGEGEKGGQWQVIYDGSCAFCRESQKLLASKTADLPVCFVDGQSLGLSPEDFREIRVRTPEGRTLSGFPALVRLWAAASRWGFFWRLWLLPPFSWLGSWGYRLVAKHRHRLVRKPKAGSL